MTSYYELMQSSMRFFISLSIMFPATQTALHHMFSRHTHTSEDRFTALSFDTPPHKSDEEVFIVTHSCTVRTFNRPHSVSVRRRGPAAAVGRRHSTHRRNTCMHLYVNIYVPVNMFWWWGKPTPTRENMQTPLNMRQVQHKLSQTDSLFHRKKCSGPMEWSNHANVKVNVSKSTLSSNVKNPKLSFYVLD